MHQSLSDFIQMGGHGFYVWTAYSTLLIGLFVQWFLPWRRLQTYRRKNPSHE